MKNFKKLGASLLALVMALAMIAPAMAAGNSTVKTDTENHTFTIYPIFVADPTDKNDGLKLETIDWALDVKGDQVYDVLNGLDSTMFSKPLTVKQTVDGVEEDVEIDPNTTEGAREIVDRIIKKWGSGSSRVSETAIKEFADALAKANEESKYTILPTSLDVKKGGNTPVPFGYSLILDKVGSVTTNMLWTIMEQTTTVSPKKGESNVKKTVWNPDGNPSDDASWDHGAVYSDVQAGATLKEDGTVDNYGDGNVKFKIKVSVPDNIGSYKTGDDTGYHITLKDQQAAGLTFKKIDSIILYHANGTTPQDVLTAGKATVRTTGLEAGTTFEIVIENVQDLDNVQYGDYIEIIYTSAFNENTTPGSEGHSNKVSLIVDGTEVGNDEAKVYRIALDITKQNAQGEVLSGVEFTLTSEDGNYTATAKTDENGKLVFEGIPSGTYTLTEVEPPKGYNKIDPMTVTINADAPEDNNGVPSLVINITQTGTDFSVSNGLVQTTVINRQGTLLPETGGIGTTIFYIAGGVLAVGAVVLLVTKRRVNSTDDE